VSRITGLLSTLHRICSTFITQDTMAEMARDIKAKRTGEVSASANELYQFINKVRRTGSDWAGLGQIGSGRAGLRRTGHGCSWWPVYSVGLSGWVADRELLL
jgi:hypothetical protein